jgi:hypothetical protein
MHVENRSMLSSTSVGDADMPARPKSMVVFTKEDFELQDEDDYTAPVHSPEVSNASTHSRSSSAEARPKSSGHSGSAIATPFTSPYKSSEERNTRDRAKRYEIRLWMPVS